MSNQSVDVEITEWTTSEKGQIILLEAQFDDTKFIFLHIYAPFDLGQQVKFVDSSLSMQMRISLLEGILTAHFHQVTKTVPAPLRKSLLWCKLDVITVEFCT